MSWRALMARPASRDLRHALAACGGIRCDLYVPNAGSRLGTEYKLAWLVALRDAVAADPDATMVCGDMNIAHGRRRVRP
jgi:exodeoxyribonuclease-3